MTIQVRCRKCKTAFRVSDNKAGAKISCRGCGAAIRIPESNSSPKDRGGPRRGKQRGGTSKGKSKRRKKKSTSGIPIEAILGSLFIIVVLSVLVVVVRNQADNLKQLFASKEENVTESSEAGQNVTGSSDLSPTESTNDPTMESADPLMMTPDLPADNTPPKPIEIVVQEPKITRFGWGRFRVELPYTTVGENPPGLSRSRLWFAVRGVGLSQWANGDPLNPLQKAIQGTEGTISLSYEVPFDPQKQFLNSLDAKLEFKVYVTHQLVVDQNLTLDSKSEELITADHIVEQSEELSIVKVIEKFGSKNSALVQGTLVTIRDVPTMALVERNRTGYVAFKHKDSPLVDCYFHGEGGVQRSDRGKTVAVQGFMGHVQPDRITLMGCRYLKPPE